MQAGWRPGLWGRSCRWSRAGGVWGAGSRKSGTVRHTPFSAMVGGGVGSVEGRCTLRPRRPRPPPFTDRRCSPSDEKGKHCECPSVNYEFGNLLWKPATPRKKNR